MPTLQDLSAQIADAEARQLAARQAEAQRIAQEGAARRQIATAAAEVERLKIEQETKRFDDLIAAGHTTAAVIDGFGLQLMEKLQTFDIAGAFALKEPIDGMANKLRAYNQQILAQADQTLFKRMWSSAVEQARMQRPECDRRTDDIAMAIYDEAKTRFEQRLAVVPEFRGVIASWVSEAEPGMQRQIRQGIAFSLTGWFCDVTDQVLARWARTTY